MSDSAASKKVLLLPDPRRDDPRGVVPLRRFRIARVRFDTRSPADGKDFSHLRYGHD